MPRTQDRLTARTPPSRRHQPASIGVVAAALLSVGCVRYEVVHYTPITMALDGRSELHISSYASWFPDEHSVIPFIYKTVRTPESIYFQVFVRDAETKAGPNPHVQSVRIHSFTYAPPNQPPTRLIVDYDQNFWMQDQPQYNPGNTAPVPCIPGQSIDVSISLELNGVDYAYSEKMECATRKRSGLLIVDALSR
jgi:hypothetical protein